MNMLEKMPEEPPAATRMGLRRFRNPERDMESDLRETMPEDRGTVLIVDDDATIRLTFTEILSLDGYRVVVATNADEARAQLDHIQPDVILCDLVMNGTNGDEFCSWLKEHATWRFVPIIAITRIDHPVALAGMLDAGADVVVVKPVTGGELRARVAAARRTRGRYVELMRGSSGT
jgi:DNA-binding response OmpR family regulator